MVGFAKRSYDTKGILGDEYVDLPPRSFHTTSLWFSVPKDTLTYIRDEKMDLMGGLHASEHAAIGVLPLFAICDRNDIGGISSPIHPDTGQPQVFIHDGHPGGVGIAETGYERIDELWRATTRPALVLCHRWRVGDVVIWDNLCTMHRAMPFEDTRFRRDMRRATCRTADPAQA